MNWHALGLKSISGRQEPCSAITLPEIRCEQFHFEFRDEGVGVSAGRSEMTLDHQGQQKRDIDNAISELLPRTGRLMCISMAIITPV